MAIRPLPFRSAKSASRRKKLLQVTQESLELAIDRVRAGNRLFDVCGTVEQHVKSNGFSIVREYVGHGIGTQLHEEPQVPNYVDRKNENPRLKPGMVLAVEPMVNAGRPEAVVLKDKWTAVTKDGSHSAHFEHCIAVTENGPWVLTRPWGSEGRGHGGGRAAVGVYEVVLPKPSRRFWPTWWGR